MRTPRPPEVLPVLAGPPGQRSLQEPAQETRRPHSFQQGTHRRQPCRPVHGKRHRRRWGLPHRQPLPRGQAREAQGRRARLLPGQQDPHGCTLEKVQEEDGNAFHNILVMGPTNAAVARRIFDEAIARRSATGIRRGLDRDGVPPPGPKNKKDPKPGDGATSPSPESSTTRNAPGPSPGA